MFHISDNETEARMRGFMSGVALSAVFLLFAGLAEAQEVEVSGNVLIGSDYTFRGISQTLEQPAIQGGLDLSGPSGTYLGVWGSSINFGEDLASGPRAQVEMDVYGGIAPSAAGFDFDIGALYYTYPGSASDLNYNFLELYGGAAREIGPTEVGVFAAYSPDFFAASGTGVFLEASASAGVPGTPLSVMGSFGRQTIEDNDAFGTPDYNTWMVETSLNLIGLDLGASVVGTSISESDCFGGDTLCGTRFIVSMGREF